MIPNIIQRSHVGLVTLVHVKELMTATKAALNNENGLIQYNQATNHCSNRRRLDWGFAYICEHLASTSS